MVCQYFLHAFFKYTQNNLEYLIENTYDSSGNSNLSFHVGAGILNLLLLHQLFMFFHV